MTRTQLVAVVMGVILALVLVLLLGRWNDSVPCSEPDPELCRQLQELIQEHG